MNSKVLNVLKLLGVSTKVSNSKYNSYIILGHSLSSILNLSNYLGSFSKEIHIDSPRVSLLANYKLGVVIIYSEGMAEIKTYRDKKYIENDILNFNASTWDSKCRVFI